jgi:hypothetical protein
VLRLKFETKIQFSTLIFTTNNDGPGKIKELTKLVGYPGQLLLDGEFDPTPSPPETKKAPEGKENGRTAFFTVDFDRFPFAAFATGKALNPN